jgi:hypothetical protein
MKYAQLGAFTVCCARVQMTRRLKIPQIQPSSPTPKCVLICIEILEK